jgi:two-component system OmpR family response regulator
MKVLFIDDNPHITEIFHSFFNSKNIECKVVNEGKKGLEEIKREDYDVIFLDIAMSDYNGYDILSELKKQNIKDNNIVILTASNIHRNELEDFADVGIKEVLTKPVSLYKIEEIIQGIKSISS